MYRVAIDRDSMPVAFFRTEAEVQAYVEDLGTAQGFSTEDVSITNLRTNNTIVKTITEVDAADTTGGNTPFEDELPQDAAVLSTDLVLDSSTYQVVTDLGVTFTKAGTYKISYYLFGQRSTNAEARMRVEPTGITMGAGHVVDHNSSSRLELGTNENNIQFQTNNEPQLIKVELVVIATDGGTLELQLSQESTDAANPHTFFAGSTVKTERIV